MTSRPTLRAALVAGLIVFTAFAAQARQVRVNVATNTFTPQNFSLNLGDHIVWIWTGGQHNVTSGSFAGAGTPDGRFNSGTEATSRTFSWKSSGALGNQPYYCNIHIPEGMTATVNLVNSGGVAGSDFRITEVLYKPAGGPDQLEITNFGATGDLSKYRLKISGITAVKTIQVTATPTVMSVPAGGRVVVHLGASGTNTATNVFFATDSLPNSGSVALFVPNTQNLSLTDATQIIDYVSWNGGSENEAVAVSAGLWAASTSLPDVAQGHSLEFCGAAGQYGTTFWGEVSSPNLGTNGNCSTPLVRSTWGRVKTLYR